MDLTVQETFAADGEASDTSSIPGTDWLSMRNVTPETPEGRRVAVTVPCCAT